MGRRVYPLSSQFCNSLILLSCACLHCLQSTASPSECISSLPFSHSISIFTGTRGPTYGCMMLSLQAEQSVCGPTRFFLQAGVYVGLGPAFWEERGQGSGCRGLKALRLGAWVAKDRKEGASAQAEACLLHFVASRPQGTRGEPHH